MNSRILELAKEAGFTTESFMTSTPRPVGFHGNVESMKNFVELLVQDIIDLNLVLPLTSIVEVTPMYKQHFGLNK